MVEDNGAQTRDCLRDLDPSAVKACGWLPGSWKSRPSRPTILPCVRIGA